MPSLFAVLSFLLGLIFNTVAVVVSGSHSRVPDDWADFQADALCSLSLFEEAQQEELTSSSVISCFHSIPLKGVCQ